MHWQQILRVLLYDYGLRILCARRHFDVFRFHFRHHLSCPDSSMPFKPCVRASRTQITPRSPTSTLIQVSSAFPPPSKHNLMSSSPITSLTCNQIVVVAFLCLLPPKEQYKVLRHHSLLPSACHSTAARHLSTQSTPLPLRLQLAPDMGLRRPTH